MSDKNTEFPQFRMMTNGRRFYRIDDARSCIELQLMGDKVFKFEFKATKYPEILLIQDMLQCSEGYAQSDETSFEEHFQKIS